MAEAEVKIRNLSIDIVGKIPQVVRRGVMHHPVPQAIHLQVSDLIDRGTGKYLLKSGQDRQPQDGSRGAAPVFPSDDRDNPGKEQNQQG